MALSVAAELSASNLLFPAGNIQGRLQQTQLRTLLPSSFLGSQHLDQTLSLPLANVQTSQLKRIATCASAAGSGNSLGRFFKKVLNSTPIIGLLSNLTVDAGTSFVHYSQFGRQVADRTTREIDEAFADLEAYHGKVGLQYFRSLQNFTSQRNHVNSHLGSEPSNTQCLRVCRAKRGSLKETGTAQSWCIWCSGAFSINGSVGPLISSLRFNFQYDLVYLLCFEGKFDLFISAPLQVILCTQNFMIGLSTVL